MNSEKIGKIASLGGAFSIGDASGEAGGEAVGLIGDAVSALANLDIPRPRHIAR